MIGRSSLISCCLVLSACAETLPGAAIASFRIEGEILSNSCDPGFAAPATISYTGEMRRTGTIGYFRQIGKPFVQGTINSNGQFQFIATTVRQVIAPVPAQNIRGCNLVQTETLTGVLTEVVTSDGGVDASAADAADASDAMADAGDGGSALSTFVGTDRLQFSPEQGSDCSRTLIANGGGFPALPCAAEYRFSGTALP